MWLYYPIFFVVFFLIYNNFVFRTKFFPFFIYIKKTKKLSKKGKKGAPFSLQPSGPRKNKEKIKYKKEEAVIM